MIEGERESEIERERETLDDGARGALVVVHVPGGVRRQHLAQGVG